MICSVNNALSAIKAFGEKMGVTADNVANVESEGFKKKRAVLQEGVQGDVHVEVTRVETPGPTRIEVHDGMIEKKESSNVDLAEEIPQTIIAKKGWEMNWRVVQTKDEMLGSILDMLG